MADQIIVPPPANGGTGSVQAGAVRAPDYRQLQQPEQGVPSWALGRDAEGIGHEAQALGQLFRQFEDTSAAVGDKIAFQSGQQAGAKAGAGGSGTPKSGLAALTSYGQGYDAAVHAAYSIESQQSLEDSMTRLEQQHIGDPGGFGAAAGQVAQAAIKQMPPIYAPEMQLWANARIQAGVNRQRNQAITDAKNTALSSYQQATPGLISSALHTASALPKEQGDAVIAKLESDDRDRLNALVAAHVITPEQANDLHSKMVDNASQQMTGQRIDLSLQPILQTMRSNVEAADKLIVQPDPSLTPEENTARVQEYEKEREAYEQQQTHAYADQLGQVHQQLAGGAFGQQVESNLHQLYQAGALSQEGLYSGLAESIRNQKKRIGDEADMQLIDAIVHGDPGHSGPLDPQNKAEAAAVDKYFQEHISQSGAVSGDQYAAGAAQITKLTGIVPSSVESHIRIGLLSGDPVRGANAAALAAKIVSVNPTANVFQRSPRLAALASLINTNAQAGMSPQASYAMAVRTTDLPLEQRKIRDATYAPTIKAQGSNAAYLQKTLGEEASGFLGFKHSLPVPIGMQAEFENLTRRFFDETGNLQQARELATATVKQTWGPSRINGAVELMKWPIPDSQVSVIRSDIANEAKSVGYPGDPANLHLVPTATTDATRGRSWGVVYTDKQGLTDVLLDKHNRPVSYHLPTGPDFAAAAQRLTEQKLAAARQERAEWEREQAMPFRPALTNELLRGNAAEAWGK